TLDFPLPCPYYNSTEVLIMIRQFSFTGAKKIVFGGGSFDTLTEHIRELKGARPMVVLDRNLAVAGFRDRISDLLNKEKLKFTLFDRVEAEPPLELADEGAGIARKEKCDIVVGIGGGSAMDVAKAIAVLAANRGKAVDYLGLNNVPGPGLPKIMIPTTAGTGSEVTFTAVFIRRDLKKKEGMNSPYLYPDLAVLDPLLTVSLPPHPTATTGIDALCHAVESYTSINASPMSELFSLEAISLIASNLRTAVHDDSNAPAREQMLLGSLYAGLGLANAGVTAVHSLSYPLGGKYGVPHGLANTVMLPAVMTFNLPAALEKFAVMAQAMGEVIDGLSTREAASLTVKAVETLIKDCGIHTKLKDLDIPEKDFPELAGAAMTVARPLENNPRKVTLEDAIKIYGQAY
ncbi:MAG: iron-containing alcohol dehydrogenase, partial [Syntrophales bacterium]|nr:iron-containing alcohol dehydrogenase [Syntrophales bacterium]